MPALKKPAEVRADFKRKGISIAEWARTHKVHRQLVYEILSANPRRACERGDSHRVAVLLGLKAGELPGPDAVSAVNAPAFRSPKRRAAK